MKKVFIKYNPYKLETEITVEGKKLAQNSNLGERSALGTRFQEWVEDLPKLLVEEYNDTDFEIVFHGTLLDYEDLTEVFTEAYEKGQLTAKLERKPAKETSDKEVLIDEVFKKIQKGPFEELRDEKIKSAFEQAKGDNFEVCVVATMSAGKSTLINAMLGDKLMPSKQEACTAIITRIKDNDKKNWQAKVYNKKEKMIETYGELTYQTMERLNGDKNVSKIEVYGDIPFVTTKNSSLVLIDTPGPNNARNKEHAKVQKDYIKKKSKPLMLYVMEGTFGTIDDDSLLDDMAKSMSGGGKQSKDRFIFVVNKMDARRKEDGDTEQTLGRVRAYLKKHGIVNPNLFPVAALPALDIRRVINGAETDEDVIDETNTKVRKLNRNKFLHLEEYAALSKKDKEEIKKGLSGTQADPNENKEDALIHTGIVSVEKAISQYVEKYSKTAKIKTIVDTFMGKVIELDYENKLEKDLLKQKKEKEKIVKEIENIEKEIDDINGAKEFRNSMKEAVKKINGDSEEIVKNIINVFQAKITRKIDTMRRKELSVDDAKREWEHLEEFAKKLEEGFQEELNDMISDKLIKTGNALLKEYINKLKSLAKEIKISENSKISIEPLKLMGGSILSADYFDINKFIQTKKIEDGEEWVENTEKKWYKPWTWFQEKGYYRTKYKTVKFVEAGEMAQDFFRPIESAFRNNGKSAMGYALEQSEKIEEGFNLEFSRLDEIFKEKLEKWKSYATGKKNAEELLADIEYKLNWLKEIRTDMDEILEI